MSRGHRRRRTALAVTMGSACFAALLVLPAPASSQVDPPEAAPTDLAETKPVDTEGIDPVLDSVPVEETAEIRRADQGLISATQAQNEALLRWAEVEGKRSELAGKSGQAGAAADQAQAAVRAAQAEEAAKLVVLADRKEVEARYRAILADRQEELRGMAATLYATAPEDRYAVLGSLDDITEASRRDTLRDRGSDLQVDRVDEARRPWSKAHEARMRTHRQVKQARAAVAEARAAADQAIEERDNFDTLLRLAEENVRTAVAALDTTRAASRQVIVDRRRARLTSEVQGLGVPLVALDAYWRASALAPCRVPWWVIAGIGRVESGHGSAQGSSLTADGDTTEHIIGIPLDGRPGVAAIGDTDGGRLDEDGTWDRAVGPMQFIPGTWNRWQGDGNADEKADPHNIYDAANGAARYLCYSRGDLLTEAQIRTALLAYNRSVPYGTKVLAEGGRYRDALDLPDIPGDRPADGDTATTTPGG